MSRKPSCARQILTLRRARGEAFEPYFFRSQDGIEADLVLVSVGELEVIEIRLTSSPTDEDIARITQTAGMLGVERATLISHAAPGSVEERLVGEPRGVPDACMSTALHQGSVPAAGHGA